MSILVTGGAGFIGSHTVVELLEAGKDIVIVDDFSNSNPEVLDNIKKITNKDFKFYEVNILDKDKLEIVFQEDNIEAVIHFAGYKAVGESVKEPLKYYHNNVSGSITLLETMKKYNVKTMVFSSSATIYGDPGTPKYVEEMGRGKTTNPYGTTKSMIEKILEDIYAADDSWNISILRYFNPVGAHSSGLIGEEPQGIPNNLMPFIMKVANKEIDHLNVFGNDYEGTKDGTGARDYIHVVDLAKGHLKALEKLEEKTHGLFIYNLGTGTAYTVLEMVETFKEVNHVDVPYEIAPRRDGDLAIYYADPTKSKQELHWETEKNLEDMCRDSWNYIKNH